MCKLMWVKKLLRDLGFLVHKPLILYYGSKLTIIITHNPVQHDMTKHVEINLHFIKEKLDAGIF